MPPRASRSPGRPSRAPAWAELLTRVQELLADADALVLAGSLPPGLLVTAYAQLIARARACGPPVLLDTHGEPLSHGAAAGPAMVNVVGIGGQLELQELG